MEKENEANNGLENKVNERCWNLYKTAIFFSITDVMSTYIGISTGRAVEANPLQTGVFGPIGMKSAALSLAPFIGYALDHFYGARDSKIMTKTVYATIALAGMIGTAINTAVCFYLFCTNR